jgi:hypothetical protein
VDSVVTEWVRGRAAEKPGRPVLGVEFGSFVGYSAMRVARHLPPGSEFVCVEPSYADGSFRSVADKILSLADMGGVVRYRPELSADAISAFAEEGAAFDIVSTDHDPEDYLPTLKRMISLGQLRTGGLYLADNVVAFNLIDLLKYLRFSGDFVDYRLYYAAIEYDDFHGQPNAKGDFYPDGVVSAVYVGPGRGQRFESPGLSVCSRFKDCSSCLANLCAWCGSGGSRFKDTTRQVSSFSRSVCVPDVFVEGGGCPSTDNTMFGLSSGDVKCRKSILGPMSWVGPEDASGRLRWQRIPGGRLNNDSLIPDDEIWNVQVEFVNAGEPDWGPVEVLWISPDDDDPMPMGTLEPKPHLPLMGSVEPKSQMTLDAMDGHTFITRCVSGFVDGLPDHGSEWTFDVEAHGRHAKVPVTKRCSLAAESGKIQVEFVNAGKPDWGLVEVLFMPPDGGKPIPMGSLAPNSKLALDVWEGNTFITRCASGFVDGRPDHGSVWTSEKKADLRVSKVPVKKRCSHRDEL